MSTGSELNLQQVSPSSTGDSGTWKSYISVSDKNVYTVKPVLRGHLWDTEKVTLLDRWPLKRGSIHMKFSMTGQKKGEPLTQVTAWAGLTVICLPK